jgi:hypothetical protein
MITLKGIIKPRTINTGAGTVFSGAGGGYSRTYKPLGTRLKS